MNRVKSNSFPNSIYDVIYQKNQFEPVTNGLLDEVVPTELNIQAVETALSGVDYSEGALYFRAAKGAEGSWHDTALNWLFQYGNHCFYK